jgi:hypothetical protein
MPMAAEANQAKQHHHVENPEKITLQSTTTFGHRSIHILKRVPGLQWNLNEYRYRA